MTGAIPNSGLFLSSVPYLVAVALVRRDFSLKDLEEESLKDDVVMALSKKVHYKADPQSGFPTYYSGEVQITLKDGRVIAQREFKNRGCFDRPLSTDDIVAKFFANCLMATDHEKAKKIKRSILTLEKCRHVEELTDQF